MEKNYSMYERKIFDVVVDIRENSPTYLKHYSIILEENDNKSLFEKVLLMGFKLY